jgi:hypothetical protein
VVTALHLRQTVCEAAPSQRNIDCRLGDHVHFLPKEHTMTRTDQKPATPAPQSEAGTDTPNQGEHLQDLGLADAGLGRTADDSHEDLLTPPRPEDQQSDDIKPGLPDFARGA